MGCDIHTHVEVRRNGRWENADALREGRSALEDRSYGAFAILAGVRNFSDFPTLVEPRGLPPDASPETIDECDCLGPDAHTAHWYTVAELLAVDWEQLVEDRRVTRQIAPGVFDGGCTGKPGEGKIVTLREAFGEHRLEELGRLAMLADDPADVRVVFWFDG